MPETTSLGIEYPCVGETVTLATLQGFSSSVESAISATNTIASDALLPDCVRVRAISQVISAGVTAAASYTAEAYDRGGMFSSGSPTVVTVQSAGSYLIGVQTDIGSAATQTSMRLAILINGVEKAYEKGQSATSPNIPGSYNLSYLLPAATVGTTILVNLLYTGSGTLNTNTYLSVAQVGNS